MADIDVTMQSNREEIESEFEKAVKTALEEIGLTAEGYAKLDCPYDTGRLRNSISHAVDGEEKAAYVGTNVEYAPYVEYNEKAKHEKGKAHFLRDAATTHGQEYKEIMEDYLKNT